MTNKLETILKKEGWSKVATGYYRSGNNTVSYDKDFETYVRYIELDSILEMISNRGAGKTPKIADFSKVSSSALGDFESNLTPTSVKAQKFGDFGKFKSLSRLRNLSSSVRSLVISFDSEWVSQAPRKLLSWQFSTVYGNYLVQFIILAKGSKRISLEIALGHILDRLGLAHYSGDKLKKYKSLVDIDDDGEIVEKVFESYSEAKTNAVYAYINNEPSDILISDCLGGAGDWKAVNSFVDYSAVEKQSITLLSHFGRADLTTLDQKKKGRKDLLKYCKEVQGGIVSMQPINIAVNSLKKEYVTHEKLYNLSLNISDTMAHTTDGFKKLEEIGEILGLFKIDLSKEQNNYIENMDKLLNDKPELFFEYASTDTVISLLYIAQLYGFNKSLPVTITSAAAGITKQTIQNYMCVSKVNDFNRVYRGLEKIKHGKVKRGSRPGFVESTSLEPISIEADTALTFASKAYHGGYNSSSLIGYYPELTFDFDIQNAYPSAMCLVGDIDWANPISYQFPRNHVFTDSDWTVQGTGTTNPLLPILAYVTFDFPKDTKFPTIPVVVDGTPFYPLSSGKLDGVFACGPEIYLAVKLGAKVVCKQGYLLNYYKLRDGEVSMSMREVVNELVSDRALAQSVCGKNSFEEKILKVLVNSIYGKTAQNVIEKHTWSAYNDEMVSLGCSAITNPVTACMTTSIVRAILLAAQNQLNNLGYKLFSVTTDGFITNASEEILLKQDLYGLEPFVAEARLFLTKNDAKPSKELWAIKHVMDDLVNFSTRGNVSLHSIDSNPIVYKGKKYAGVCAHNGAVSGFTEDSFDDRFWLIDCVLSRTESILSQEKSFTSFKDIQKRGFHYIKKTNNRRIGMDYDMKRKPIKNSFTVEKPFINGKNYEIANFDTEAFENVEEYKLYRNKKQNIDALRTVQHWKIFWNKINSGNSNAKPHNYEFSRVMTCVIGHRARLEGWDIPMLDKLCGQDRYDWINKHNPSTKEFKKDDWTNAQRSDRITNMLPYEAVEDLLLEMQSDSYYEESEENNYSE